MSKEKTLTNDDGFVIEPSLEVVQSIIVWIIIVIT